MRFLTGFSKFTGLVFNSPAFMPGNCARLQRLRAGNDSTLQQINDSTSQQINKSTKQQIAR